MSWTANWHCIAPSRPGNGADRVLLRAERGGQLAPQSLAVQSVGVLIGSPSFIAGKLPWSFGTAHIPRGPQPASRGQLRRTSDTIRAVHPFSP